MIHENFHIRVFASDADVGKNAELFYNITNGDPRFSINENGYIATNTPAKAEEVFTVTIQVTDRGLPPQMNQAKIIMTAIATKERAKGVVNRAPEFVKNTSKKIPVSDADQVGFTIGKFEAMDPDGDTIWWSIIDGNLNDTFSLKSDSGLLQLSKPIESIHHNISSLILLIQISDGELNDTTEVNYQYSFTSLVIFYNYESKYVEQILYF
ncbi:cadherin domain protein [Dictyocaulus viviparus]|uniref:Cadherin domain protein n=1 Tax=Dictyocaulus viviparus TaxID=29172 RepID=A0A0D8XMX8_DICVI|nr:cadherin domain protein [Dictyocaulus viviparus]